MLVQVKQPVMRQEFGLWWTPKEIDHLRELGILGLDMPSWQVQQTLSNYQIARDGAVMKGVCIGWTMGLIFMLGLRWLGS